MTPLTRKIAELHAQTSSFRRRESEALAIAENWLMSVKQPYVAYSTGKDSTVVLDLVRRLAPETTAIHNDHEWYLPESLILLQATPNVRRIARPSWHAEWFTSWAEKPDHIPPEVEWSDHADLRGVWAPRQGFDGCAVGLRADENSYRRVHIRTFGQCFFVKKYKIWQCYPVAWWSARDIWAYIISHGVPYNAAYDRLDEMEITLERQRIGPFAVERALGHGQLALLKKGWPEVFQQFIQRYPEASSYV